MELCCTPMRCILYNNSIINELKKEKRAVSWRNSLSKITLSIPAIYSPVPLKHLRSTGVL